MWILDQKKETLIQTEGIKRISIEQFSDEVYTITVDSGLETEKDIGFFNSFKAAEDAFNILKDWLWRASDTNFFDMPDDESEPPRAPEPSTSPEPKSNFQELLKFYAKEKKENENADE